MATDQLDLAKIIVKKIELHNSKSIMHLGTGNIDMSQAHKFHLITLMDVLDEWLGDDHSNPNDSIDDRIKHFKSIIK